MADARLERGELFERGLAGRFVHPLVARNALAIGVLEVADQLVHLLLGLLGEVRLHVNLADAFAEGAIDRSNAALPALALLLNARELLRIKGEARVVERLGQHGGMIGDEAEGEPFLPGRQRRRGEDLAGAGDGGGLGHDHRLGVGETALGERRVPVELRRKLDQLRTGHRIVDFVDVAAIRGGPLHLRELGLEHDDAVGCAFRIGQAGELLDGDDIAAIGGAVRLHLRIVFEIIFAARHPEARLTGEDGVDVRVLEIRAHADIDGAGEAGLDEQRQQLVARLRGVDLGEVGLQRRGPGGIDRVRVDEARIIIADLLAEMVAARIAGELLDDLANVALGAVGQSDERTGRGTVGRDLGLLVPVAVDIGPEVVARLDRAVHRRTIVAPVAVDGLGGVNGWRRGNREKARGGERQGLETHGFSPLRWNIAAMP